MIRPSDIAVVIQGPVVGKRTDPPQLQFTRRAAESVRRVLPGAQIILSTWKGSDASALDIDVTLYNDDPGAVIFYDPRRVFNNVNRQIVSTRNGIAASDRQYVMKLRSDAVLEHTGFLSFFSRYSKVASEAFVSERLVGCTDFSRRSISRSCPLAYHPSDLWYFGCRQDMSNLWDCPLTKEPEFSRWFDVYPLPKLGPDRRMLKYHKYRYTPEQYIWLSFLRKYGEYPCNDWTDIRPEVVRRSEMSVAANLVLVSPAQLGVKFLKFDFDANEWADSLMSHGDWLQLYRRYCLNSSRPVIDRERLAKFIYTLIRSLRPLYQNFTRSYYGRVALYLAGRLWDRYLAIERRVFNHARLLFTGAIK